VSISVLGYAPSFFGQISDDTILVAHSPSFLNALKLCCLVLFSWRKTQQTNKKCSAEKNVLPHISTMGAL